QKTPHPSAIPTEGRSDEWSDLLYASHAAENRPLGFARGDGQLVSFARAGKDRAAGGARVRVDSGTGPRSIKHRSLAVAPRAGFGAGLEDLVDRAALVTPLH